MANYTIELRDVVKSGVNIFPHNYEFYDETKRAKFESDFIKHFYFREIGAETIDRFIFYLDEKMQTVFPYYNELFKASQIKYDVLDNYKLTETTTRKRENTGKSSGVSSTVGQLFNEETTENSETARQDAETTGSEKDVTVTDGTTNNTVSEKQNGTTTKVSDGTTTTNQDTVKKHLDTPQGLTDLKDSKYLTTLGEDTTNGTSKTDVTDTVTEDKTRNVTETGTTTNNGTNNKDTETKTTATDERIANGTLKGEQKSTNDNNTRSQMEGSEEETIEIVRRGNIGVDTDSDAIKKHIKLQEILTKIELMFFDECEDLFMLVY